MTDLEKDKILLLAHSIGKMARELESIKRLLKEIAGTPQTETKTETQNSNLTFEKADEPQYDFSEYADRLWKIAYERGKREALEQTEPQTYVINPQEPTNDDKCFECDDFFTCGGQCNKIEDEPPERSE